MPDRSSVTSSPYNLEHFQADRLQQGDQQVFGKLYDQYAPQFLGVIQTAIQDEKIAAETLHTCFGEIWNHFKIRNSSEPLYTSMLKIVRRLTADKCLQLGANASTSAKPASAAVQDCLVFNLIYRQGMNFEAVAEQLQVPVETLRIRFRNEMKEHFTNKGSKQ
jgi:DNA-directed RNA polymerase specialized sigma24 family protein